MRHKTHVLIPYTTTVACGAHNPTANGAFREQITCKVCRKSAEYKGLPNLPRAAQSFTIVKRELNHDGLI